MKVNMTENRISTSDIFLDAADYLESIVVLRSVRPIFETINGERTSNIIGARYDVFCPNIFATARIKVEGTPVITVSELESMSKPLYLELPLEKMALKIYKVEYGTASVSITAPYVKVVRD